MESREQAPEMVASGVLLVDMSLKPEACRGGKGGIVLIVVGVVDVAVGGGGGGGVTRRDFVEVK